MGCRRVGQGYFRSDRGVGRSRRAGTGAFLAGGRSNRGVESGSRAERRSRWADCSMRGRSRVRPGLSRDGQVRRKTRQGRNRAGLERTGPAEDNSRERPANTAGEAGSKPRRAGPARTTSAAGEDTQRGQTGGEGRAPEADRGQQLEFSRQAAGSGELKQDCRGRSRGRGETSMARKNLVAGGFSLGLCRFRQQKPSSEGTASLNGPIRSAEKLTLET